VLLLTCAAAGIVILMFDTQMEPAIARDMIKGAADPLVSAFQLRYSQLLQLARTEGTTAEMLLQVRLLCKSCGLAIV
jgi:ATP-dependent RNA helicase DOB1